MAFGNGFGPNQVIQLLHVSSFKRLMIYIAAAPHSCRTCGIRRRSDLVAQSAIA
jgi:hypothetical protein